MTSVCVTSDSTNHLVWKRCSQGGSLQPNVNQSIRNVLMSKTELHGPSRRMKRARCPIDKGCGYAITSSSTVSVGMAACEQS